MSRSVSFARGLWQRLLPWLVPLLLVIGWQIASLAGWLNHRVLPAPSEVLVAFWQLLSSGDLFRHLAVSFARVASGFVIGAGLGLAFGLLAGVSRLGEALFDTTLQMLRNIPPLAILPLVILWFGIDESAKVFLVAFGVLFPVYLNTYHGIRSLDPQLLEMARSYGVSGKALFWQVVLPGALPSILVGIRYALGIAWIILIVAETLSATSGIGYLAANAREFLQTDIVVLSILLYAALGKVVDVAARALEKRWLRWHPSYFKAA
ncbi:aliphatic sulfonate ABC transporter permease SsuC [Aquitalea magnusonii]|uniref:Sulfonate transport system permease protein n=1 Tax=Aquitalea magnusonii TaxID=332411 RepID=A0A318J3S3_9NEIS|nr:aliphatic sulfonate ABC transporter permease SsuC [Aquitalea magnusonii]PXX42312.1 sulfonate transport system permease protein [Aquitalea magnusonii]